MSNRLRGFNAAQEAQPTYRASNAHWYGNNRGSIEVYIHDENGRCVACRIKRKDLERWLDAARETK